MGRLTELFSPLQGFGNDFMESAFGRVPSAIFEGGYPALNVWEKQDKVFIEAELPGVLSEDLNVSVAGADLTISGNRKTREAIMGEWRRHERPSGQFSRSMSLPWDIAPDSVEAALRDGVLTITLTKSAQCQPRKVAVRAV